MSSEHIRIRASPADVLTELRLLNYSLIIPQTCHWGASPGLPLSMPVSWEGLHSYSFTQAPLDSSLPKLVLPLLQWQLPLKHLWAHDKVSATGRGFVLTESSNANMLIFIQLTTAYLKAAHVCQLLPWHSFIQFNKEHRQTPLQPTWTALMGNCFNRPTSKTTFLTSFRK